MFPEIYQFLDQHDYGSYVTTTGVLDSRGFTSGKVILSTGKKLYMKRNNKVADDRFLAEADGLRALAAIDDVNVVQVLHASDRMILLDYIKHGIAKAKKFDPRAGRMVALIHGQEQARFGWHRDSFCGPTRQINTQTSNGHEFFAEHRLIGIAATAYDQGLLNRKLVRQIEYIAKKLPEWIPHQPPVLLHGDLWSGNIYCGKKNTPFIIDPACYWGWAETDLAMASLFGGFSSYFFDSYAEHRELDKDWRERAPIYNIYHLINHVLIHGDCYLRLLQETCNQFASDELAIYRLAKSVA